MGSGTGYSTPYPWGYGYIVTLQRYLVKYLVQAPFPMREIGAVMAQLHASHQLQDLIRLKDFERQHDFQ